MKNLLTLMITASIFASNAQAFDLGIPPPDQYSVKLGGWSHHIANSNDTYNVNESHEGIGIESSWNSDTYPAIGIKSDLWYMFDSNNRTQKSASISAYKRQELELPSFHSIDFNISIGYMSRSIRMIHPQTFETLSLEKWSGAFLIPYVTIHHNKHFQTDLFYIPGKAFGKMSSDVIFWRIGITL